MARPDGRALDHLRNIKISTNVNKYAEGSCLIEFGDTKVLCTASVDTKVPIWMRGNGSGWITAEYGMLPRSCENRLQRDKKNGRTHEIQRLIGRSLRSAVDMDKLGENTIWIDCDVMQADGGTRTASITGGFIAMVLAMESMKKRGILKDIPVNDYLAAISVGIHRDNLILDLNYIEDSSAEVDMNVVMNSNGGIIEVQGTAEGKTFSRKTMDSMMDLAEKGIKELMDHQRTILRDILLK